MANKEEKKIEGSELKDQEQKPVRIPINSDGHIDTDELTPEQLEKYSANADTIDKAAILASVIVNWVQKALLEDPGSNGQPEELQKLSLDAMEFGLEYSSGEFTGLALWPSVLASIFAELDSLKKRLREAKYTGTLEEFTTPAEDPETGKVGFAFDLWQTDNTPSIGGHRVKTLDYPRAQIEALPRYEEIGGLPAKYVMPNDPLTNSLIGRYDKKTGKLLPTINAGAFDLPFIDSGKPTETTAYTIITLAEEYTENFAPDELSVLYGVISILSAGRESFTAEEVLRTMRPKSNTGDNRKKTVEEIDRTIIKLCNMPIKSNLTPILQRIASDNRRQPPLREDGAPLTEYELNESALMLTPATMKYGNGKVIPCYSVVYNKNGSVHEPQLLTVARMLGQVIQTDIDNMAIQEVKNGKLLPGSYIELTWGRTTIRDYLYRRIAIMKNDQKNKRKRQSHTILFGTLYTYTGTIKGSKTEKMDKKRAREFALACLDYWKVKRIIKDYNIEMQGRQYRSIEIVLPKVQEE